MSIKVCDLVWRAYITPASHKLALLALADWADDAGGTVYPSMAKIANKIGLSTVQTRVVVHALRDRGLLSVLSNAKGGRQGSTPRYRLNLTEIQRLAVHDRCNTDMDTDAVDPIDRPATVAATALAGESLPLLPAVVTPLAGKSQTVTNRHSTVKGESAAAAPTLPPCPIETIKQAYGRILPELPAIKVWTSERQRRLTARWKDRAREKGWTSQAEGIAWFESFFETVRQSDFLMGRQEGGRGHEGWRNSFDFLIGNKGFIGVIEGKYASREAA